MTREYCKYHSKDAKDFNYCSIISECSKLKMEPQECRPKTCPLDQRGCRVASACLQDDVIDAYQKAIDKKKTTTTTTTAATAAAAESAASKKKTVF
jgi:urease accessory protein UreF